MPIAYRVAIVVARFNEQITNSLLQGAVRVLQNHNLSENQIEIFWVPGSFEIPLTCQKIFEKGSFDAAIALGAIIKGETSHFDFVASETAKGIRL